MNSFEISIEFFLDNQTLISILAGFRLFIWFQAYKYVYFVSFDIPILFGINAECYWISMAQQTDDNAKATTNFNWEKLNEKENEKNKIENQCACE